MYVQYVQSHINCGRTLDHCFFPNRSDLMTNWICMRRPMQYNYSLLRVEHKSALYLLLLLLPLFVQWICIQVQSSIYSGILVCNSQSYLQAAYCTHEYDLQQMYKWCIDWKRCTARRPGVTSLAKCLRHVERSTFSFLDWFWNYFFLLKAWTKGVTWQNSQPWA